MEIPGIHHVTTIAGDAQRNVDFHAGVLGMRFVKLTVNRDDPTVSYIDYGIYYGDGAGRPGSLLAFFAWPGESRGRLGTGMAADVALGIPHDAAGYRVDGLARLGSDVKLSESLASVRERLARRLPPPRFPRAA